MADETNAPGKMKQWTTIQTQLAQIITGQTTLPLWVLVARACQQKIDRLLTAREQGQPIFWYHGGLTPEIFMGLEAVEYVPVEFYPLLQLLLGYEQELQACIETAEATGISSDLCSLLKASLGAVIQGCYPPPALLVHTPSPCAAQSGLFNYISEIYGVERAIIDIPRRHDPKEWRYTTTLLGETITLLEEASGQSYDWVKLAAALTETDRTLQVLSQWCSLRKHGTQTQSADLMFAISSLMILLRGEKSGTALAEALRDDLQTVVDREPQQKDAGTPPPLHAIWFGKPYWGQDGFYDRTAAELNIQFMMGNHGYYPAEGLLIDDETDDPITRLARRIANTNPINRYSRHPLADYLDSFSNLRQAYQPDFGIIALNRGCKHDLLWAGAIREEAHRLGLPVYIFEFDMLDARIKTVETIHHELGNFIGDMQCRKQSKIMVQQSIITAGIDIGSTSSKAVLWQGDQLLAYEILPSMLNPPQTAQKCYEVILNKAGLRMDDVAYIVGTGYGRSKVSFANENVSEISCHGRGAAALLPSVRTILDIGGQDTKAIAIDSEGRLQDFSMNDKCAAGTGKFLEITCRSLGLNIHALATFHFQNTARETVPLSNVCSVFLESEIINLVNEGFSLSAIIYSLHQVVAKKVVAQGKRVGLAKDVFVSGGVAKNAGVIDAIERLLGYETQKLPASVDPQLIGAVGAAVIAQEKTTAKGGG